MYELKYTKGKHWQLYHVNEDRFIATRGTSNRVILIHIPKVFSQPNAIEVLREFIEDVKNYDPPE